MNRLRATQLVLAVSALTVALFAWTSSASAATFGATFGGQVLGAEGLAFTQAGGHPDSMETTMEFNSELQETFLGPQPAPVEIRRTSKSRCRLGSSAT